MRLTNLCKFVKTGHLRNVILCMCSSILCIVIIILYYVVIKMIFIVVHVVCPQSTSVLVRGMPRPFPPLHVGEEKKSYS